MDVHTNIPLKNYTTMKLGGPARFMTVVHTPADVESIVKHAKEQNLPFFVLGGGSNTIARDEGYNGVVIQNKIAGFEVLGNSDGRVQIKIGAGENWDEIVKKTVEMNLSGIEAMSAIPGTAGAAPVQNVGAYGQEVADTLVSLEAFDTETMSFVVLQNADCSFSYRNSIFRSTASGRFVITSITLELYTTPPQPPFYAAVQEYMDSHGISIYTPQTIRDVVTEIRREKLPDPATRPNSGSFFKNAVIEKWQLDELEKQFDIEVPRYDMPNNNFKIPTGWLIEQAGYKGKLLNGIRVHDKNALVLINESATSFADLVAAREEIKGAIRDNYRITIDQEPLEL